MPQSQSEAIHEAAAILERGGLVAFPTETVYGLGADASNADAVARLYAVKGRPADHPCIVHLADVGWLERYARDIPPHAYRLAETFWPGPLTLILYKTDEVVDAVSAGLPTVGLRVPKHPLALELLSTFGKALVAPSANRFGRVSPTTAAHVAADLGDDVDLILDGGPCRVGVESTIVDCTTPAPRILRPGGLARESLQEALDVPLEAASADVAKAPGTLPAHYAPRARLRVAEAEGIDAVLNSDDTRPAAVFSRACPFAADDENVRWVEAPADPESFAHELYAVLRALDDQGVALIIVEPVAEKGLGVAINDRLRRAARGSRDE